MSFKHLLNRLLERIEHMDQAAFDAELQTFLARVDALLAAFEAAQVPPAATDLSAEGQQIADAQAKIDAALPPA